MSRLITYGLGLSESGTAASFLRPSKRSDQHMGFLEAMQKKYVSDSAKEGSASERAINISGKTVEEVGFDKVRQQLAALQELRIVILDRLCVAGFNNEQWDRDFTSWWRLASMKLKIAELDLSNNLIEKWADVVGICSALKCLRSLKLE